MPNYIKHTNCHIIFTLGSFKLGIYFFEYNNTVTIEMKYSYTYIYTNTSQETFIKHLTALLKTLLKINQIPKKNVGIIN